MTPITGATPSRATPRRSRRRRHSLHHRAPQHRLNLSALPQLRAVRPLIDQAEGAGDAGSFLQVSKTLRAAVSSGRPPYRGAHNDILGGYAPGQV
jgi:hypothetical protein